MVLPKSLRNRVAFFGYRSLARLAEVLPESGIRPVARLGGSLVYTIAARKRAIVTNNLARVVGHHPSPGLVKASFVSYSRYWLDSLRLPVVPAERLGNRVQVEGIEHIRKAQQEGKGIVLALPHLGNWDLAGAWLVHHGVPLTVVVERIQPPELFEWFENFRSSVGFKVLINGPDVGRTLLQALRKGEAIGLLCDRDVDGTGGVYEFFGEPTSLPRGPATLALRTNSVIVTAAGFEAGANYRGVINPPIAAERQGSLREDVDRVTAAVNRQLEELIRSAPEQWHCFQPNWPADGPSS